jgi:hypothetical protein
MLHWLIVLSSESHSNFPLDISQTKSIISFTHLLLDSSAGRIAITAVWWMNQFSPVDILPPWFSMLIYHLGDEQ